MISSFGNDLAYWRATSPFHVLSEIAIPFLVVCSTRHTNSCSQAAQFVTEAKSLSVYASVLEQNLFHKNINLQLGLKAVTNTFESFMGGLDASVIRMLTNRW